MEGYAAVSRVADLKLPAVVLENSLVCFEVYTPQSVLTSTQRAVAIAIFTSCGRIGLTNIFLFSQNVRISVLFIFFKIICASSNGHEVKAPGSQSKSRNQCISYNSHSLLILSLKFMLPSRGDLLLCPLLLPPTGGSLWHKSIGQMPSDPKWYTFRFQESNASQLQDNQKRPQWNTTHQTWITSRAHFAAWSFFFPFFLSTASKSPEKMLWENDWGWWRGGETEREREKRKTQDENKTTQLVHLCHCKWVKSPCVFVRVHVNKMLFEVRVQHCTVASLRPLLSLCKNVLGDYRKYYRIES